MILLVRVDSGMRMNRWYCVVVQPTLLDGCAVLCLWGSRRTGYQRGRVISAASEQETHALAEQIVARKLRQGYVLLDEIIPSENRS